jgi:hypothetical protein
MKPENLLHCSQKPALDPGLNTFNSFKTVMLNIVHCIVVLKPQPFGIGCVPFSRCKVKGFPVQYGPLQRLSPSQSQSQS